MPIQHVKGHTFFSNTIGSDRAVCKYHQLTNPSETRDQEIARPRLRCVTQVFHN